MRRAAFSLVALVAAVPAVGCGTMLNQSPPGSYFNAGDRRHHRLYGGVRTDGELMAATAAKVARGEPVSSSSTTCGRDPVTGEWVERDTTPVATKVRDAVTMTLFLAADFPLSFVADTVLLPWDIRYQWLRLTGRTPPNPFLTPAKPAEKSELPPAGEKPREAEPPVEGADSLKSLSNNPFNSWQVSHRTDLPLYNPRSPALK